MDNKQQLAELFQPDWYLQAYPDVAAAGMEPWQHFSRFGAQEGRLPCYLEAADLEQQLWFQLTEDAGPKLQQLLQVGDPKEQAYATWVLARWHASYGRWNEVLPLLDLWCTNDWRQALPGHHGCWLLLVRALQECGQCEQAYSKIEQALAELGELPDLLLARASLHSGHAKLDDINRLFAQAGLTQLQANNSILLLDNLTTITVPTQQSAGWLGFWPRQPLVSVIMPCFNAGKTITTAIKSLQAQSWQRLDIIVVDDASCDDSVAVVAQLAASDHRIRLVQQAENQGAYAARNAGLALAKGQFITTHDSDDWSHPEKIERQVRALLAKPKAMASISHWVRTTPDLRFERWRPEPGWIYRNTSSLMFRRKVFRQLGFWDRVSVNADTEYLERIVAAYGAIVDVLPGVPLAFGRSDANSLTQQSGTHLRTQFVGVRQRYLAAARAWHTAATKPCQLHMAQFPEQYAFPVPALMCRGTKAQREGRQLALLKQSALFDAGWYLQTYSDVAAAGMDPALHYLRYGGQENRDPGPDFSSSGYRLLQSVSTEANPLLHYLETLEDTPEAQQSYGCVQQRGQCPLWPEQPWLMVVCHAAGPELFGAERSLLDVLDALQALQCNVLLTLPGIRSESYLAQLKGKVQQLAVLPYRWWHREQPECQQSIQHFVALMQQYRPQLCYCNTLVLSEPLHAARQLLIPGIVHVRELPEADAALCQQLGADAGQIRQHLLALADGFIANSQIVADYLAAPERTRVIVNVVDTDRFAAILPRAEPSPLRIGMISSNLPKKGLQDFIQLSQLLAEQQPEVECWLIGPDNEHTTRLKTEQAAGRLPTSLHFAGYVSSPEEALAPLDIVVNLSHFQESFGRTVLEAMAAGKCVIAYDWGALPELVEHGKTGLLVPFGEVDAVVEQVHSLVLNPVLRQTLQQQAQQRVLAKYTKQQLIIQFEEFLQKAFMPLNRESL